MKKMDNKSRRDFLKNSSLGVGGAALAGVIPGLNISAAACAERPTLSGEN